LAPINLGGAFGVLDIRGCSAGLSRQVPLAALHDDIPTGAGSALVGSHSGGKKPLFGMLGRLP
jgi:hypothetical protein